MTVMLHLLATEVISLCLKCIINKIIISNHIVKSSVCNGSTFRTE